MDFDEEPLTKKERKTKTVGRKSINYPKRSEIIKIDPVQDLSDKENETIESNYEFFSFDLNDIEPKLAYHCSKCGKKYDSKLFLNRHSKIDHKKIFYCSKCPNFYEKENSLKSHVILMH